jgi:hypothetical protein
LFFLLGDKRQRNQTAAALIHSDAQSQFAAANSSRAVVYAAGAGVAEGGATGWRLEFDPVVHLESSCEITGAAREAECRAWLRHFLSNHGIKWKRRIAGEFSINKKLQG